MKKELYKKDGDKTRYWSGHVYEHKGIGYVCYKWGEVDGKLQTKVDKYIKGKNIGRSNETSPFQQAQLELRSKLKKKRDKGYLKKGEKAKVLMRPMLAYAYEKHIKKILNKTSFKQPKFDGIRMVADTWTGDLFTRTGKLIVSVPHISDAVLWCKPFVRYLDGELFNKDMTFQEITKIVKREKEVHEDSTKIQYHVYDCITDGIYSERMKILKKIANLDIKCVRITPTVETIFSSEEEIKEEQMSYVGSGYEGMMIRLDEPYKLGKRSSALLKVKSFQDSEYEIVNLELEKFKDNQLGSFVLKDKDGKIFNGRPAMKHSELKEIVENGEKYIGALAKVKYFELTDDGIPRFPVVIGIRWKEDM